MTIEKRVVIMIIYPAIDIQDRKVVRLKQGRFDDVTEYSSDPVEMAKHWAELGAQWLHVVDLDGAKTGEMKNLDIIHGSVEALNIPVQMGGGVRSLEAIESLVDSGVSRVILGTRIVEDRDFLKEALSRWSDKIAVSLDCSNGFVAQRGWTTTSEVKATDLAKELETMGLTCLIYTNIACDGMLTGPDIDGLKELLSVANIPLIASGGVSCIDDIKVLSELTGDGLLGAITGRAIYEGKLDFKEALEV